MRRILLSMAALCVCTCLFGQAEKDVRTVIDKLFVNLHTRDSASAHKLITNDLTLSIVAVDQKGQNVIRHGDAKMLLAGLGSQTDVPYTEPIWNVDIKVDGAFAQVWCDYAFYRGKELHHCGVDTFQLFLTDDGWKIFNLAYTHRTTDCDVPEDIKAQFN